MIQWSNDTNLQWDNPLLFKISQREHIIIMTINEKVRNEKLQYNINRVAAKISVLS